MRPHQFDGGKTHSVSVKLAGVVLSIVCNRSSELKRLSQRVRVRSRPLVSIRVLLQVIGSNLLLRGNLNPPVTWDQAAKSLL